MNESDDVIARLVSIAAAGPAIPAGGAEAIKQAIRPIWVADTRRRTARRRAAWALAIAASLAGMVLTRRGSHSEQAEVKWIEVGSSSREIRLDRGQLVRIEPGTRARMTGRDILELDRGGIYVECSGHHIEVRTTLGIIRDSGTTFEVHRDRDLLVRVREGSVIVSTPRNRVTIERGFAATFSQVGTFVQAFEIEGKTVAAFLGWVAHDTGIPIVYATKAAERAANATVLHGALGGLGAAEAPEVILPTAGLRAKRARDALVVSVAKP